ncbi:two-component response regulator [Gloeomargarita lithophora Alchichica-D10]|uniref:Two-component response regulator n=1 Tax=Gloeomargarita lithophora Alchichica-D10 TaxID=1188229 RepID=A0A1J0ABR2_9CYAN|nr:response regulator [Gloeomargarita lithophora]APB33374.1 two-component response regulator [Gloeomargarita lithophora Alchichica-D10]
MKTVASPYKALQELASRDLTGCLTVHDPCVAGMAWSLYVGGQRLYYASSIAGQKERLSSLLCRLRPDLEWPSLAALDAEPAWLREWWQGKALPLGELRQLVTRLSQEALIQAVAIPKAPIDFQRNVQPNPILITPPWQDLLATVRQQVYGWQLVRGQGLSPLSRLYLDMAQVGAFCDFWEQTQDTPEYRQFWERQTLAAWIQLFGQKLCVYEFSAVVRVSPLELATRVRGLVGTGTLVSLPFQSPAPVVEAAPAQPKPVVACIDDSKAVQRQVQMTLELEGYDILGITEPARALTTLVRRRPEVILMDINMPDIDGYELCRMLRQSRQLKDVPILMLTGRDGLIDRLRAQLVGANSYLTKPFAPEQLTQAVQKLIHSPSANGISS